MNREYLVSELESYRQRFPEEKAKTDQFIEFVASEPLCFERSLEKGHITGSAWLLNPNRDKTLLTHHRKLDKWLQLGGHADGDSDVLRVAEREAEEESGISGVRQVENDIFDIDIHAIPARKGEAAHLHFDVRFLFQAPGEEYVVSDESNDLCWMSVSEAFTNCPEESMQRLIRKWQERLER